MSAVDSSEFTTDSLKRQGIDFKREGSTLMLRYNGSCIRSTIYYSDWTKTERALKKKLHDESTLDQKTIQEIISCMSENYRSVIDAFASYKATKQESALASMAANTVPLTDDLTRELTYEEIAVILSTTIKRDKAPKLITFNAMLLAQTDEDQLKVGHQSESSSGKSHITLEVAAYFPKEEIEIIAYAS